ncbi:DUF2934 domain-containing protein [Pseudomonas sp. LA21]|uniref:DUF2934 domain-containing protein n=1 Tax=unclassified Pseudomonas TaxID=196821 RepID=UPI001FB656A9|nr:DUF2934 domain-containing protein [Pseudomonas sp. LA21]MCJ1887126.1 DUF2934 domain-containing protein [Pseudomonas sp. LA21]
MSVPEKRVRELAYQIWEAEGRPEGQHERHWRMARSLAEGEAVKPLQPPEDVQPRFEGKEEPEPPAILQPPPRRQGQLPEATPEAPAKPAAKPRRAAAKPAGAGTARKPTAPSSSRAPKNS